MLQVVYGIKPKTLNDQYFARVERMADVAEEITVPGRFPVEAVPALRHLPSWFPGGRFKKWAREAKHDITDTVDALYNAAKLAMVCG